MKRMFIITAVVILVLVIAQIAHSEYNSSSKTNVWIWTPTDSSTSHYIVQKSANGGDTWETLTNAPHDLVDVNNMMVIRYDVISVIDESYQLRVAAVSGNDNQGPWSFISDVLHVRLRPGTPAFITETE